MLPFAPAKAELGVRIYMFYRRKVLLGLLEALNRKVPKTDMQKYLFLVSREQETPSYHFVPYRFGCYSFQADADKRTLAKYGLVKHHDKWALNTEQHFLNRLRLEDHTAVTSVVQRFSRLRGRDLIRYVYHHYPYYAINSEIRDEILNGAEKERVEASRPEPGRACLYTIGYQGQSLEQYLNKLIEQSVAVLCDVRRNAVSMKFGFSKRLLQHACNRTGIDYVHMPELGIESRKRRGLDSPADYGSLFRDYVRTTLTESEEALDSIVHLVRDKERVALTCFEADAEQCHRGCVAAALLDRPDIDHRVFHL